MESYAVLWTEEPDEVRAGKLELGDGCLRFDGPEVRQVPYEAVERVHMASRLAERIRGRPALVLDLAGGRRVRIGSVVGVGTLHELAERLARLTTAVPS